MTDTSNGKWSTNAVLALLTALLGVEGFGTLKSATSERPEADVVAQVRENAALIRSLASEQRELHFAIKTVSGSVEDLAQAVEHLSSE